VTPYFQEDQLEAVRTQVAMQKIVIGDLERNLSDALALVEKLQVRWTACATALEFQMVLQEELKQERIKNASFHGLAELPSAPSMTSISCNESLLQAAPGSRLKEALSIIAALRQSISA
jgi:hypothetical protein